MPHSRTHGWLYCHGLTVVLLSLFLLFWLGQTLAGWHVHNDDQREHRQAELSLAEYLRSAHMLEATAENWESEFLQMAAFVWLTSFLFQKGSPESKDPNAPDEPEPVTPESPWPVRRGGWIRAVYSYSLTLAFLVLFLFSFSLHALGGVRLYNEDRAEHGESAVTLGEYLLSSQFWFESLQNWQSEFLSIAAMVVFAIYLRQKNSPESKPVEASHARHE